MTSQEMQSLWDSLLIYGFRNDKTMPSIVFKFIGATNPLILDAEIEQIITYMSGVNIRRCRDKDINGNLVFNAISKKATVKTFVCGRSPQLAEHLFNNKNTNASIYSAINTCKWVRKRVGKYAKNEASLSSKRERNKTKSTIKIKARSLSSGGWSTVS